MKWDETAIERVLLEEAIGVKSNHGLGAQHLAWYPSWRHGDFRLPSGWQRGWTVMISSPPPGYLHHPPNYHKDAWCLSTGLAAVKNHTIGTFAEVFALVSESGFADKWGLVGDPSRFKGQPGYQEVR